MEDRKKLDQTNLTDSEEKVILVNGTEYFEVNAACEETLRLLTQVYTLKDPFAKNHAEDVAELSLMLASNDNVDLSTDKLQALWFAANLHDIGKLGIPSYILDKPMALTKAEYYMVKQHTVLGYELAESLHFDPVIPSVIRNHHENWDGSGYPDGLRGYEIPLAAQIVRISDFYISVMSNRPHRPAHNKADALDILQENRHIFDPYLLDIFLEIV